MLSITKMIVNVFYNNKQRIANDFVLKDTIAFLKKAEGKAKVKLVNLLN